LKLDGCSFDEYIKLMRIVRQQCDGLTASGAVRSDLLKAIDEYNYCTYSLKAAASDREN
jgi:hypothetical protein